MKKFLYLIAVIALSACAGTSSEEVSTTPTVDYVENLDVYSAEHQDSFLNQLAMNYRSYAIFNARTSGFPQVGEQFAQKSVSAFSGETPFPESVESWPVSDNQEKSELVAGCNDLINALKDGGADLEPVLASEAQAKFDCWLSSASTGQADTAEECKSRFEIAMYALKNNLLCEDNYSDSKCTAVVSARAKRSSYAYYPETSTMRSMTDTSRAREGIVIVNNINIPSLIQTVPVPTQSESQPIVLNQSFVHSGAGTDITPAEDTGVAMELVGRDEFVEMMNVLRDDLAAVNARLDKMAAANTSDRAILKVQQIPLEPKQHIMEEIFEVRFDFDKSDIKPEYKDVIEKLVETTRANRNVKISVVGHTDTVGSNDYNYALGGRRAEAVKKMLVEYGIPADQIVSVSSGKIDPKVPTGDGVNNAENRRVRVVKETHYLEQPKAPQTTTIEIEKNTAKEIQSSETISSQQPAATNEPDDSEILTPADELAPESM